MEWYYPKSYDRGALTPTVLPLDRWDKIRFTLRVEQIGEELAGEILLEALAAMHQVETLIKEVRAVDREIRRLCKTTKNPSPEVPDRLLMLSERRSVLQCRGKILLAGLRKPRFGKHLPRTKRGIARKTARLIRRKPPAAPEFSQKTSANVFFRTALSEPASNPDFSGSNTIALSMQLHQNEAKADFSATYRDDKLTVLQKFITEGKI